MHTSNNFTLRGGDAAFANRQQALFDQLLIAENNCNKHDKPENMETDNMEMVERRKRPAPSDDRKQKRETKRFSGKESIFKRPEGPAPRTNFRNIPDYHRNPHKWVKYSLDVSSEDMTEHSNTQAAMSFLRELKARRKKEEDVPLEGEEMDVETCESNSTETRFKKRSSSSQITFKKPRTRETMENIAESDDKPIFRSSKIILPEYVIGQKPKRTCKQNRPVIKVDRSKELRLDHLQEPDEEEDD